LRNVAALSDKIMWQRVHTNKKGVQDMSLVKILSIAILILIISSPAIAGKFLFICNDLKAEYYDKVNKEGPSTAEVHASVLIDTDENTAELLVGSRDLAKISSRSNSNMSLHIEKESTQLVFVGTTHDETTYFTLYTKEMKVLASYGDILVVIKGCINDGN
jgi:hypothetical protein